LGLVIWIGLLFSIPVSLTSYWVCSRFGKNIMVDGNPEMVPRLLLPGWKSALPLVTPVLLIAIGSFSKLLSLPESVSTVQTILGIPLVALLIGLALAFLNINFQTQTNWPVWISEALKDAGLIILITGAGGAFGAVIKAGGIEKLIQTFSFSHSMGETGLLVFGFTVAAILKSAQGSTTSSMIITSSIVGPMTVGIGIASQLKLSLILMAIGGGAMTVSHANDSYFWVMSKFGGITHRDMLKSFTPITLLQGLTVLLTATLAMQCV
jgi:GntP family gluconate:H+ symporter